MNRRTFSSNFTAGLIFSLAVTTNLTAAEKGNPSPRDVSPLLEPIIKESRIPGIVAVTIEGNSVVAQGAAGVREVDRPEKVTLKDRFHIGSCTKAMTATLCAMLVEEGKLSWQTTIGDVFPDLNEKMNEQYRAVTLEQLLTNRGGVPTDLNANGLWLALWLHKGDPTSARDMLLRGVVTQKPEADPGSKFIYSNGGFAIAGHMAEAVTKKPWETLMREKLFKPLGMSSAGFGAPGVESKHDQPRGHNSSGKAVQPGPKGDNPVAIGPAGIVHCSILDWSKFAAMHLRGAQKDAKMLTAESFEKLHTPVGEYAMGWGTANRPWANGQVLTHAGSNTMWYAVTWIAPKRNFAVLVACNHGGGAKACDQAASALIGDFLKNSKGK